MIFLQRFTHHPDPDLHIHNTRCPTAFNPLQLGVKQYDIMGEFVELENGDRFYPIPVDDCATTCQMAPGNTAYIGPNPKENWGMAFSKANVENKEEQTTTTTLGSLTKEEQTGTTTTLGTSDGRIKMISTIATGVSVFMGAFLLSA
jgi:hypothetical protein